VKIRTMLAVVAALSTLAAARPAASQSSGGIAFDQIDRLLLEGATPPPPGSFRDDAARIAALQPLRPKFTTESEAKALTATMMLSSGLLGMIPIAGSFLGMAASKAMNAAYEAGRRKQSEENHAALMAFIATGTLSRFAFYHSWARVARAGTETRIEKADQGLTILLDDETHTARSFGAHGDTTYVIDTEQQVVPVLDAPPEVTRLPDLVIDGRAAHGYRSTANFTLPQQVGWCKHGPHRAVVTEYVLPVVDPEPAGTPPPDGGVSGICAPNGTASIQEPGKLVVYRATELDSGSPEAFASMLERSNVRELTEGDAPFFSIPPGFTEAH
jgi:hypothetical protein